ncbi:RHS repeat-associated core domain-containing protein [Xenorhabdus mauleonii]|uniref:RHS repeat-associated core domain-containing protein n=1 Tax=Xenorhabdus mauleonii TaxID=351675 RepID=A0A1I3PLF2_9GAMM|nr:hypothetical protein [Xenorhabdus mauleonii]PHM44766.1 RHS repeat-associated core domain-containing protein [Xenorhabdus mauleonii]SFJ22141.1 hypothetical protein SAMN05421680_106181 [Xenorhabdus mauleonii]
MRDINEEKRINAANLIKRSMRQYFENKAIDRMSSTLIHRHRRHHSKKLFDFHKTKDGRDYPDLHSNMKTIAKDLKNKLGAFNEDELGFVRNFYSKEFYIVHASDYNLIDRAKKSLTLLSRVSLQERKIPFDEANSKDDATFLGNDKYVFFSLEVGREPKKKRSNFGNHFYRIRYSANKYSLVYSSMVLYDQLYKCKHLNMLEHSVRIIDRIGISSDSVEQIELSILRRTNGGSAFSGYFNSINGLLYSLLIDIRELKNEQDKKKLLSASTDEEFNNIINGFYRPEVRIPIVAGFFQWEYEYIERNI